MHKWKLEQTQADIRQAIWRHTHTLDGEPDTSNHLEQEYITKELIKLRDLITFLLKPDTSNESERLRAALEGIANAYPHDSVAGNMAREAIRDYDFHMGLY